MIFGKHMITAIASLALIPGIMAQEPAETAPVKAGEGHVLTKGVEPGKFTQDYDAAVAYAKEKKLPILMIFTGSDWCGWCKVMDKNVFTKPEWTEYAKDKLVMVWLDFPKDKSLVPEAYVARNEKLKDDYQVGGYPTYWILDWDGRKLDRLGAGREKTAASFSAEVEKVLKGTAANIEKLCATYKPEDAARIRAAMATLNKAQTSKDAAMKKVAELQKQAADLQKEANDSFTSASDEFKKAMEQGKIGVMNPETIAKYNAAKKTLAAAEKALEDWMKANRRKRPTPELNTQYGELKKAIETAQATIDAF